MTCDERQDLLPMYALGTLEPADADALRGHLAEGCPACLAALAESRALTRQLAMSLEPVAPPAKLRERLIRHATVESTSKLTAQSMPQTPAPSPPPRLAGDRSRFADWARSLVAAAAAAAVVYFVADHSFDQRAAQLQRQLSSMETQLSEVRSSQKNATQMIDAFRSPAVQFVLLQGTENSPGAKGNLYWDKARGVWYFYVTGMKPAPANQTYELWFVAGDKKTRAGTFDVTPEGEGALVAALPADIGKITLAAVTNEPAGGSVQPTGKFQLTAEVR